MQQISCKHYNLSKIFANSMDLFWQVMRNLLLLGNGNLYKLKIIN